MKTREKHLAAASNRYALLFPLIRISIFCSLLLLTLALNAQQDFRPGYYVTHANDTVSGFIDYRGNTRNTVACTYKENTNAPVREFYPGEIKAYNVEGQKLYVSKTFPMSDSTQTAFVEFIVEGVLNLFFYNNGDAVLYLLEDSKGAITVLEEKSKIERYPGAGQLTKTYKRYIGFLKLAMSDCKEIQEDIESTKLTHKSLYKLLEKYQRFVAPELNLVVHEKYLSALHLSIIPYTGIGLSTLNFKSTKYAWHNYDPSSPVYAGIAVSLGSLQNNRKFSFDVSGEITRFNFKGDFSRKTVARIYHYESEIQATAIKPSACMTYHMPGKAFKPAFSLGLTSNLLFSTSENYRETMTEGDKKEVVENSESMLPGFYLGFVVKSSTDVDLFKGKLPLFFGAGYSYTHSIDRKVKGTLNSLFISTGIHLNQGR